MGGGLATEPAPDSRIYFGMRQVILMLLLVVCLSAAPTSGPSVPVETKCRQLAEKWQERLEKEQMSWLISPPFVIAGDGLRRKLEVYRDKTILAATRALQASLFDRKLDEPVLILLFESAESYQRLSKKWFDDVPDTPYGYFRRDGIMV